MGQIEVEGVTVAFRACGHCGATPGEADALKFIKAHETTCDFCRHAIRVIVAELDCHRKDRHGESWEGMWGIEPNIVLHPEGEGRTRKVVHLGCYEKMFPDGDGARLAAKP